MVSDNNKKYNHENKKNKEGSKISKELQLKQGFKEEQLIKQNQEQNENNFIEYIEQNLIIRSKNRSLDKFICNKEQKAIIEKIQQQYQKQKKVRLIILKGRQIGVSTLIGARGYYKLIKNKGYRAMLLAHRQSATNNMFDIAYRYLNCDVNINKKDFSSNKNKSILFKTQDSSYVFATAGSTEVGRSDTIQFFHGSEVAFWNYEENHLSSIFNQYLDLIFYLH